MKAASLVLRNPKDGIATLYAEYSHDRKIKRVPTGVKVVPRLWDATNNTIKRNGSANPEKDTQHVRDILSRVNGLLRDLHKKLERMPSIDELNAALEAKEAPIASSLTVCGALEQLIKTKRPTKQEATVKSLVTLLHNIEVYQVAKKTTWLVATLTNAQVDEWQDWLMHTYAYKNSTLRKRVLLLKQLFNESVESVPIALNISKVRPKYSQGEKVPFTLNMSEIEAIRALDLSKNKRLEKSRDMLVLQSFTGLRWSDCSRLEKHHISNGMIKMRMQKLKDKRTSVPLLPQANQVIHKYTDPETGQLHLPIISNQKQNDYIKELCALVPALNEMVLEEYSKGKETIEEKVPKYKLVGTHTARRSFITLCLEMGVEARIVMGWSGHATYKSFQRYVNKSQGQVDAALHFAQAYAAKAAQLTS
ncbi:tyrosine-type recombinase/integrase [Hymenobacter sp. HSC-4F20]|uniref:site-specific integrase n=1 Tax=Hymenobacter sp. HSC-4F20 TaxID=2864135 RepID=UPI001C732224|nr:site-specific integrase [Hymenobacter sp. HSC-4F20]MBX0291937.1 tyrosine-type recombinase/integrase [Hymenobacter sp. HSC-4F20]